MRGVRGIVEPGADVRRSVVGPGCRVAGGASVVDSVLGRDCVVEDGAVIERSLLGNGVVVTADAVVRGLSVIGDGEAVDGVVDGELIPLPR